MTDKQKQNVPKKKQKINRRAEYQSSIDQNDIVVIDNGTDTCKIGISGQDMPRLVINTLSGTPELKNQNDSINPKIKKYFGTALQQAFAEHKHVIHLKQPIQHSLITSMQEMQQMWKYIFVEYMQLDPTNLGVLYIDSPHNNKQSKTKILQTFFDVIKVNSIIFMNSASLSLFSTGHTIGLVTQIGHGMTTTVPVFEGYVLPHAMQQSKVSGYEITKKLQQQIRQKKIQISFENELAERDVVRKIKEKMSLAAQNYKALMSKPDTQNIQERSYELPDGSIIQFPIACRVNPVQILFQPEMIGATSMSLTDMMATSLQLCDPQLQQELSQNMVLCGGSSMIKGIKKRIQQQMSRKALPRLNFEYVTGTERRYSAWIGGSMLGSLSAFQELAILKSDFQLNQSQKEIHKKIL